MHIKVRIILVPLRIGFDFLDHPLNYTKTDKLIQFFFTGEELL